MKIFKFICIACLILFSSLTYAQETLAPTHWANDYIVFLKTNDVLTDVNLTDRPFDRSDIAKSLLKTDWKKYPVNSKTYGMLKLLVSEFTLEMQQLDSPNWRNLFNTAMDALNLPVNIPDKTAVVKSGFAGELYYVDSGRDNESGIEFDIHPTLLANWYNTVTLFANFKMFSEPQPNYIGKEYKNAFAYMEQGYLQYKNDWFRFKFGRDWYQSGPGKDAQLLFSDNSRPFDLYHLQFGKKMLQFSFWGMQMDRVRSANRFINGHRVQLNFNDKMYFGFSEAVLYGGENKFWDMGFANPLGFYYFYNLNQEAGGTNANIFYTFDWDLFVINNLEIYGEFLIDDFQVDNEVPGDLEPNELGLIIGTNWVNPGSIEGSILNAAYTQVRNRTYNVQEPFYGKYLHRNEEIGHYLGNNFWKADLGLTYYIRPELRINANTSFIRQGEGSVSGEFNTDFLNATVEEGYSENFPFGIVEKTTKFGVNVFYKPHPFAYLEFNLNNYSIKNFEHIEGISENQTAFRIVAGWEWEKIWQ